MLFVCIALDARLPRHLNYGHTQGFNLLWFVMLSVFYSLQDATDLLRGTSISRDHQDLVKEATHNYGVQS